MTDRQFILLSLIESTHPSYWIPRARAEYCDASPTGIIVGGAGDSAILRGFKRKGLTETPEGAFTPYASRLTEKGKKALACFRQQGIKQVNVTKGEK
jgi:hypothetical protein